MNTRLISVLTIALLCLGNALVAQTAPSPAPSATWTVSGTAVSQYMFRGVRLGGPSFQPAVEYGYGALALGVWANFPIKDKVPGQSDPELDLYGSYKFALADNLSLQPGFTWYNYPDADKANGFHRSSFEPSLALNYTVAGLSLTPKVYYDMVLDGATYEINAFYALPLKQIGSELDFMASVGTFKWDEALENSAPSTKNWGDYWLVGVSLPYQVSANSKVILGFAYTKGSGNYLKTGTDPRDRNTAAVGRGVATLTYAMTF